MPRDPPPGRHLKAATIIEKSEGHWRLVVEEHYDSRCRYKENWRDGRKGERDLERVCYCKQYNAGPETTEEHFTLQCHWKKITDEEDGKVYLIRKCYCD